MQVCPKEDKAARVRIVALHRQGERPARELDSALTVLGSGEGADLILGSSQVAASHAALVRLGGGAFICDLGAPGGTRLDGRAVRWARLGDGDEIAIGRFRLRVEIEDHAGHFEGEAPTFSLRNEPVIGVVTSVDPVLVVGSDPGCDVVLHHDAVAARHCLVIWTQEGPVVRDLQRRKQTRLNGRRIEHAPIVGGDSIGVGPFELIFETELVCPGRESTTVGRQGASAATDRGGSPEAAMLVSGRMDSNQAAAVSAMWTYARPSRAESREGSLLPAEPPGTFRHEPEREVSGLVSSKDGGVSMAGEAFETRGVVGSGAEAAADIGESGQGPGPSAGLAGYEALEARRRFLDRRVEELRARVAGAQSALDQRAQSQHEKLKKEREHLRASRAELQEEANRLLKYACETHSGAAGVQAPPTDGAEGSADQGDSQVLDRPAVQRAMVGYETTSVRQAARELAEIVRAGREEVEREEGALESLQTDIGRLGKLVIRTRQDRQARDSELESRFQALEGAKQELWRERNGLTGRIRKLDTQVALLKAHIKDAERCREDSEREGIRLAEAQTALNERRGELHGAIEREHERLLQHQASLRRKTAELAKAAREKRRSIMAEVTQRQADLDLLEAKMKIRRASIETAGREALERTAKELDEVLRVGLGEIETELEGRHARLEARASELVVDLKADASGGSTGPAGLDGGVGDKSVGSDREPTRVTGRRFQTLVGEIESLQDSLAAMRCSGLVQAPSEAEAAGEMAGSAAVQPAGCGLRAAEPVVPECEKTGTARDGASSVAAGSEAVYALRPIQSGPGQTKGPAEAK